MYTTNQAAEMTGETVETLSRMCNAGWLEGAVKVRGKWQIPGAEVTRLCQIRDEYQGGGRCSSTR